MADNTINSLTDESIDILQEIIDEYQAGRLGGKSVFPPTKVGKEEGQVYVARVPSGGIPAMVGNVLGEAECELFKLQISGSDRLLIPLTYPDSSPSIKKVYNPFSMSVVAGYHIILPSKSGPWVVACAYSNGNDGGGGGSGCCCDAMACVDLCTLTVVDVVTECAECPTGATKIYSAGVASGSGWITTGTPKVTHVGGCTWESAEFGITIKGVTGTYKWVFVQAGAASTLTLEWVSGDDPVQACASYASPVVIQYLATTTQGQAWSCLCNSKMTLQTDRALIPFGSGLRGEICVVPQSIPGTDSVTCVPDGEIVCYRMSVSGVSTTKNYAAGGSAASEYDIFNGDFTMILRKSFEETGNCCIWAPWGMTIDWTVNGSCNIEPAIGTPQIWSMGFGCGYTSPGSLHPIGVGGTTPRYDLTSGTIAGFDGTSGTDTLVFTMANPADGCNTSDTWPTTITMTRDTACLYINPDGCDCPGGGGTTCSDAVQCNYAAFPDEDSPTGFRFVLVVEEWDCGTGCECVSNSDDVTAAFGYPSDEFDTASGTCQPA